MRTLTVLEVIAKTNFLKIEKCSTLNLSRFSNVRFGRRVWHFISKNNIKLEIGRQGQTTGVDNIIVFFIQFGNFGVESFFELGSVWGLIITRIQ